ncbi:FAD/NAD(P)-binding protein [Kitasatospora camelliae]|uniref:FAD/NAD(P)-binding protein n=1 Tax=Kitasatospora camelliae TaxID=3156397 RepID=A0AAU8JXD1_9ACTN
MTTRPSGAPAHRIAVVGSGPRGLMVAERLAARLAEEAPAGPVELYLIDEVEVGCGRVWRSDQPEWFMMNTVADEISAFSGTPDSGPARAGAGPSFGQWWSASDPDHPGPNSYAPRAVYGRYLRFVLDAVEGGLPAHARLHRVTAAVQDLERTAAGYRLTLADGTRLPVDRVVLTTGHARPAAAGEQRALAEFASDRPHLRYIRGDSAADMPLEAVPAGAEVGILGLGLSFYDVMAAFTIGRGGRFVTDDAGVLRYVPSGREPFMVAGSRSGMLLPARGRNQKSALNPYRPVLFTPERIRHHRPKAPYDFASDVLPWLLAEVELVYYGTELRQRSGEQAAAALTAELAVALDAPLPDVAAAAARHGVGDLPRMDLDRLARPFERRTFADPHAFEEALTAAVREDLEHAERGNVDSPLKAALDVLRDTRWVIRQFVDFSGLNPASHRSDFLGWYVPRSSFLAAGPPRVRLQQASALIARGLLRIAGPDTRIVGDEATGRFLVSSPRVAGSEVAVDHVIDARIPNPDVRLDPAPLTSRLRERGVWTSYVNRHGAQAFDTGGVAVTGSPYHPVGADGRPEEGLYVLGIPTEHTRWFTQVGSSRPGLWSDFVHDADAIAVHALAARAGNADAGAGAGSEQTPAQVSAQAPAQASALVGTSAGR